MCNPGGVHGGPAATTPPVCTHGPGLRGRQRLLSRPNGGTCDGQGNCVACQADADCEDNNDCTDNACVSGECVFTPNDGNQCSVGGLPGTCNNGDCEGLCQPDTCPDNGTECVTDVCDPADGSCNAQNDPINAGCDLGSGPDSGVCDGGGSCVQCNIDGQCPAGETCVGNVCEGSSLVCEYVQDFEALDPAGPTALEDDGWLYFGNVFDAGGNFKFGFGPFAAPTVSGQISGVATGEGGPDQGDQQLVVFSNYDCCQPSDGHFNGTDLVETIVFQEPWGTGNGGIPASEIGNIFTFEFDAKRGNIEGATTAQAFIRTLDPNAGFATTNNVVFDTTNLPTDWGTYSIELDLSDPLLEGQILQFGFSTIASNFEGAGNFYDNVSFCTTGDGGGGGCSVDADCPDDGNECTAAVCNAGDCGSTNLDGLSCDNGAGTCQSGACVPSGPIACEYEEDFEALDPAGPTALEDNGWLYFGNVFDSGSNFKFGFGPFAAPTVSGQISGIASGEGGPDQGNNQLVVFSNYDCCQPSDGHFNGTDLVETIVFQEPWGTGNGGIPASEIGNVFTFQFDAKRGNIGGSTTAQAFIRTLDPNAGFATTNNVVLDTTNLPTEWNTYTIQLDLSDPALQGQILQFGFSTIASNFESAGNFYDNISFCTDGDNGGGGPGGELTTNGDFETGDFTGWTNFCDQGAASCTVTMDNPNGGSFAARLEQPTPAANVVIKQERIAAGQVANGDTVDVSFSLRGAVGVGGVVFLEVFTEETGGGVVLEGIFGPLFPTAGWVQVSESVSLTGNPGDGITVQIAGITGGDPASFVDIYVDDVSAVKQ